MANCGRTYLMLQTSEATPTHGLREMGLVTTEGQLALALCTYAHRLSESGMRLLSRVGMIQFDPCFHTWAMQVFERLPNRFMFDRQKFFIPLPFNNDRLRLPDIGIVDKELNAEWDDLRERVDEFMDVLQCAVIGMCDKESL